MKNKPVKKPRTPRTIADLKFNWKFVNYEMIGYPSIEIAFNQISEKNSKLKKFRVVPNSYSILVNDRTINIKIYGLLNVIDFFEIICFRIFINGLPIIGKFSHFERINDQTYRIHMKK